MGYTTDLIGHIKVNPPLNDAEQQYLTAFADSRRFDRVGGPYEIPGNPAAECYDRIADLDRYNTCAPGQPSLWCEWVPCFDGCCISHSGREKFYGSTHWLSYLIDHFLASGAAASRVDLPWFTDFTFDHVLDGVIAANNRETRELYLIRVERNAVREEIIVPGESPWPAGWQLPYEESIDELDGDRTRRRRGAT